MASGLRKPTSGRTHYYQLGTQRVVDFLARNASRCADASTIIESLRPSKAQLRKGHGQGQQKVEIKPSSVRVRIGELLDLARVIGGRRRSENTPETILLILDKLITDRKDFARWLASLQVDKSMDVFRDSQADLHFTFILEEIRSALKPVKSTKSSLHYTSTSRSETVTSVEDFAHLVQVPVDDPLNVTRTKQATTQIDLDTAEITLEGRLDSEPFALWCHLQDLNDMRTKINSCWDSYRSGKLSLLATCMFTEETFHLMSQSDRDFTSKYPMFEDWFKVIRYLQIDVTSKAGISYIYPLGMTEPTSTTTNTNPTKLLCADGAEAIRSFHDRFRKSLESKQATPHDEEEDDTDFKVRLWWTMTDIFDLMNRPSDTKLHRPTGDIVTQAIAKYFRKRKLHLWLAVASQVCIDINDLLSVDPDRAYQDLSKTLSRFARVIENHYEFRSSTYSNMIPDTWTEKLRWIEHFERSFMISDRELETRSVGLGATDIKSPLMTRLRTLPTAAAISHLEVRVKMYQAGIELLNDGRSLLAMIHLYKAARYYNLLERDWPDLEFIVDEYGPYEGPSPEEQEGFDGFGLVKHYLADMGVSSPDLTKDQIPTLPSSERICQKAKRIEAKPEIARSTTKDSMNGLSQASSKTSKSRVRELQTAASGEASDGLTPLQSLDAFRAAFTREEVHLNFDFVLLWRICVEQLDNIREEISSLLPEDQTGEIVHDHQLVYYILLDAAKNPEAKESSSLMARAATIINNFMANEGDLLLGSATRQSSGHLPAHMNPKPPLPDAPLDLVASLLKQAEGVQCARTRHTCTAWDPLGSQWRIAKIIEHADKQKKAENGEN